MTLLKIKGLKKSYGNFEALHNIDIEFKQGEFVVFIGSSGAGKSTFIRCINKMVEPTAGSLEFDGVDIAKLRGAALRKQRSKIGMIFQHYNLIGRVNVIKNVMYGLLGQVPLWKSLLGLYPEAEKRRAVELLDEIGLSEQMYKRADALSGGQMQRVGICRSIMQNPKLLLADEPIASLDPKSSEIVMDSLRQITNQRGLCCIVNLHQVDYARKYADRIIGMKAGEIVFDGKPEELTDAIVQEIYAKKDNEADETLPLLAKAGDVQYA
jgi:phosphonate transport system ATP-binding protein